MNVRPVDILLVEDNRGDAFLIEQMLIEAQGFACRMRLAESLTEGIAQLHAEAADVVLLDLGLPESQGLETLQHFFARVPGVPTLVVLSGLADERIALQALQAGAQDYLIKGKVDSALLTRSIRYALERSQAEEALRRAHDNLELRVQERTAELATAIDALEAEIAERKRAEEALNERNALIRGLVESNIIGILLWDIDGNIIEANDTFLQITGHSREDLQAGGLKWPLLTADEYRAADERAVRELYANGHCQSYEKDIVRKDGSRVPVLIGGTWLEGSDHKGIAFVLDVSARRQAEKERQARELAEAASRSKSEFLANLSHELRSPLNAILGFARLVERRPALPPDVRNDMRIIVRSGEHLHTLISQVLDLSKIEAGRVSLNMASFDLNYLLDEMEDMFSISAHDRQVRFEVRRPSDLVPHLRGDVVKLRQILINLLNNAFKFTEHGKVALNVSHCTLPSGELRVSFAVSDTGSGIDANDMEQLFDAFAQGHAGRQAPEGTGLGLGISRSFVQLMGGDMRMESQAGQGTLISFEVPLAFEAADTVAAAAESPSRVTALAAGQPQYRILVADDQRIARQLLVRLLTPLGFAVREASNGEEAVDIWRTWRPHLIWMDMRMPVLSGQEAARRIRTEPGSRDTVIIALTASSFKEEWNDILDAGCNDLLSKPFAETELFDLMQRHLGVRFVRGKPSLHPPSLSPHDEQVLATLPTQSAGLERSLSGLDAEAIDRSIAAIRMHDQALADALQGLADDYQYEQILQVIQHTHRDPGRNGHGTQSRRR